ncbi:uncharacterized protein C8Q71DRAFT_852752 [Rhodofomes roseus]|uniref:Uncharacterized protein n=1 Tax=Rhodofomes roseus TaxID=34475 RepID=A0ABQ8KY58_9APHY|nr:uncharacterized protein C8Q71DRAFT_852752 [Rhodofomes roseus]KAH9844248.1 hypothetical protein C8Q71DRAFT_852752 [Rhodofomes roseus]
MQLVNNDLIGMQLRVVNNEDGPMVVNNNNEDNPPMVVIEQVGGWHLRLHVAEHDLATQPATSFPLDTLKDNKPEQGHLQLEMSRNLQVVHAPQVAILGNGSVQVVAENLADIKHIIVDAAAFPPDISPTGIL